jgi:DNA repair exonuclease SbcCD ATPase subunit
MNNIEKVIVGIGIGICSTAGGLIGYKIGTVELGHAIQDLENVKKKGDDAEASRLVLEKKVDRLQAESVKAVEDREAKLKAEFQTQKKGLDDLIARAPKQVAELDRKVKSANDAQARIKTQLENANSLSAERVEQLKARDIRIEALKAEIKARSEALACLKDKVPTDMLARINAVGAVGP